jgi:tetratricopeptide (TPR) repeat protein
LCEIKLYYEYDFKGAEAACKRAIEKNPNLSLAHIIYSQFLTSRGRFDEAIAEVKRAIDLEPASLLNQISYGINFYYARRYAEAVAQFKRVLAMDENYGNATVRMTVTLAAQGNESEAFESYIKEMIYYRVEETIKADQETFQTSGWQGVIRKRAKRFEQDNFSYFHGADVDPQAGNTDKAFEYLKKSYERREVWVIYLRVDPRLDPLRDDPRFEEMVRRVESKIHSKFFMSFSTESDESVRTDIQSM